MVGKTSYLVAILLTTSFFNRGELSEPSGEYAVNTIPFFWQNSTTSCCGQDLSRIITLLMVVLAVQKLTGGVRFGSLQEPPGQLARVVQDIRQRSSRHLTKDMSDIRSK